MDLKKISIILVLIMLAVMISSCAASMPEKERIAAMTAKEAKEALKDRSRREICDKWGEPDGTLSGFYGDIYVCSGRKIVIYYDGDSKITDVLISDK